MNRGRLNIGGLRLVVEVTERTIDKRGQRLLAPQIEL